jgi:hypothetical protein
VAARRRGHRPDGQRVFLGHGRRGCNAGRGVVAARDDNRTASGSTDARDAVRVAVLLPRPVVARPCRAGHACDADRPGLHSRRGPVSGRRPAGVRGRGRAPRLPDSPAVRQWTAAGVARQRRDHTETAKRDRPDLTLLPGRELEHSSRGACPGRPCDRRLRGVAREGEDLPQRQFRQGHHLRPRHDRRGEPGRAKLGPPPHRQRRRDRAHLARAPLEHRAVAVARRREGREDPRRAATTTARCCSTSSRS